MDNFTLTKVLDIGRGLEYPVDILLLRLTDDSLSSLQSKDIVAKHIISWENSRRYRMLFTKEGEPTLLYSMNRLYKRTWYATKLPERGVLSLVYGSVNTIFIGMFGFFTFFMFLGVFSQSSLMLFPFALVSILLLIFISSKISKTGHINNTDESYLFPKINILGRDKFKEDFIVM